MQLLQYAVLMNEKRDKDGEVVEAAQLLVEPTSILAADAAQAQMIAARAVPEDAMTKLDRLVVLVSPF